MLGLDRSDRIFDSYLESESIKVEEVGEDRKGIIARLRANRRARRLACDDCYEHYLNERELGFDGSFLQWLIANKDQIFKIILQIIALFGA